MQQENIKWSSKEQRHLRTTWIEISGKYSTSPPADEDTISCQYVKVNSARNWEIGQRHLHNYRRIKKTGMLNLFIKFSFYYIIFIIINSNFTESKFNLIY